MMAIALKKYQKLILVALFTVFLIVGYFSHNDYGIAWDEPSQFEIGKINYEYLLGISDTLATHHDRHYGAAFELPLYAVSQWLPIDSTAHLYHFRHAATHLLFIISLGFFFALLYKCFQNFNASIIGVLMLYLHPRIFAHSFFNSKDIVFMSLFIIGLYTLFLLLEKPSKKRILFHAITSALLIDVRILGIVLPALSLLVFLPSIFENRKSRIAVLQTASLYLVLLIIFVYAFWPALWSDPFLLGKSFLRMSHFPFRYDVLFQGALIPATQVPWNYIPVWFSITTPIIIILLFLGGFIGLFMHYFRNADRVFYSKPKWFILVLSSFPFDFVILLILINSSLYDGWRQVYFLYPLILLSAVYAYIFLQKKLPQGKIWKIVLPFMMGILLLFPAREIYQNHPLQHVYFNSLVPAKNEYRSQNYEMDYWGLSFHKALTFVVTSDHSPEIKVCFTNAAGPQNILMLPPEDQIRIKVVNDPKDARYFITNYRYHPQDYNFDKEVYSIYSKGSRVLSVFEMKH